MVSGTSSINSITPRIELLTSFYKHPLAADSILTGFHIYCVFGGSADAIIQLVC